MARAAEGTAVRRITEPATGAETGGREVEGGGGVNELTNVRVWYDPNTGRLQVTAQADQGPVELNLKHVTLRIEYGSGSSSETSIKAYPRRRGDD